MFFVAIKIEEFEVKFGQKIALRIGTRQIVRMSEIKEKSFQI
jgi:hypothetical protein